MSGIWDAIQKGGATTDEGGEPASVAPEIIELEDLKSKLPWKYIKVKVNMGSSETSLNWAFGYEEPPEDIEIVIAEAAKHAADIAGNGVGFWVGDEGATIIFRDKIHYISVQSYMREHI